MIFLVRCPGQKLGIQSTLSLVVNPATTCTDSAVCRCILDHHEDEHCVERDKELVRTKDLQQGDIED